MRLQCQWCLQWNGGFVGDETLFTCRVCGEVNIVEHHSVVESDGEEVDEVTVRRAE